jgi:hypothetical protein
MKKELASVAQEKERVREKTRKTSPLFTVCEDRRNDLIEVNWRLREKVDTVEDFSWKSGISSGIAVRRK